MNETINISLTGLAFTIEADAYKLLNDYLDTIRNEFDNPEEAGEILADIEARISELILTYQNGNTPISKAIIEHIISQLGYVNNEEMGEEQKTKQSSQNDNYYNERKLNHRLYRNPKGSLIGGVCSGIAAYFHIDTVLVRLAFILLPFINTVAIFYDFVDVTVLFTSIVLYIILWIIVPLARTPRQTLEMEGEEITRENLESRMRTNSNISTSSSAPVLSSVLILLGYIIKTILYIVVFATVIGSLIGIIAIIVNTYSDISENSLKYDIGYHTLNMTTYVCVYILPYALLVFAVLKYVFKVKVSKFIFLLLISLILACATYSTVMLVKFKDEQRKEIAEWQKARQDVYNTRNNASTSTQKTVIQNASTSTQKTVIQNTGNSIPDNKNLNL